MSCDLSDESRATATTSATPDEEITSGLLATTSSENAAMSENTSVCGLSYCCFVTRKFTSLVYLAFLIVLGVVFLVAVNVNTVNKGRHVLHLYLTAVMSIAILWMAISIFFALSRENDHNGTLLPPHLIVGVMFFGCGSSFLTTVELIVHVAEYDCPSQDVTMLVYYIVQTIFIYTQLYFFYKLSSHSEKVLIFGHFLIMHLIAVNLGTWIVTFVHDSAEELSEGKHHNSTNFFMEQHVSNVSDSKQNLTGCLETKEVLKTTAEKMEPILYTFTLEYSLISAGLLLNAWLSLNSSSMPSDIKNQSGDPAGHKSQSGDNKECKSSKCHRKGHKGKIDDHKGKSKDHIGTSNDRRGEHGGNKCSGTNFERDESLKEVNDPGTKTEVGTFWCFGFILGLVCIPVFTANVFNTLYTDDKQQDQLTYIGFQFFFFLSILAASFIGSRQLIQHNDNKNDNLDFKLLGISLVGVFLLDLFIIIASICEAHKALAISISLIVTNATELLCSVMFTFFVREAFQRKLEKSAVDSASRIREVVSFLFMLNICFWAMYTFEVKKSNTVLSLVEQFYGTNVWFYISHSVYPFAIFFHFHGAVCMVEILNHYSISDSPDLNTLLVSQPLSETT